jgi:alpha,alpha-trehalase
VYESGLANKEWLLRAYEKLKQDYLFWTDTSSKAIENHNTPISGLQRFYHHATREELLEFYNVLAPRFDLSYDVTDEFKLKMGEAWMTEAEVGMDFTPRFENRCHEFIAIDLYIWTNHLRKKSTRSFVSMGLSRRLASHLYAYGEGIG